jgi:predicted RNA-binding Zn-ribbon protein involved in translation (DUF1610 family)
LNKEELLYLQSELEEMREFAVQFAEIRKATDLFLEPAPAAYPSVESVRSFDQWQGKFEDYEESLEQLSVRIFEDRQADADEAAQTFQKAASEIARPKLQPLVFKRPMQPGVATFALLCAISTPQEQELERKYGRMGKQRRKKKIAEVLAEGQLYTYVLALVVHGKEAFAAEVSDLQNSSEADNSEIAGAESTSRRHIANEENLIGNQPQERFVPNVKPGLFYVNYPHTPFVPPRGTSVLLFPVECGADYHEHEFLRRIIERQRERQEKGFIEQQQQQQEKQREEQASTTNDNQKPESEEQKRSRPKKVLASKDEYFPRNAPLGSARLLSQRNEYGTYDFYVHIPVDDETPPITGDLSTVLGFHEHSQGYSYAQIDFKGNVLELGDLMIAAHALPKEGDTAYSENYVFETVKAMISLARPDRSSSDQPAAIIGLEDASWKKQRVSLSREINRLQLSRPSRKIAKVLSYKAPQAGLPRPLSQMVSLRECSNCGVKPGTSVRKFYPRTTHCARCGCRRLHETEPGSGELKCQRCKHIWQEHEPSFLCPACGHNQIARLNTAIIVARKTLTGFVNYYAAVAKNKKQ